MKRDPSIHIRLSDLEKVLEDIKYARKSPKQLASLILENAQKYQITDRYLALLKSKAASKKKMIKSMENDRVGPKVVQQFQLVLGMVRQERNPKAKLRNIHEKHKDYQLMKEIAGMAHDFSTHFEISPILDGYKEFIRTGLTMMRRYSLNRFKTYESRIYDRFDSFVKVANDQSPEDTTSLYHAWIECMGEYAGLSGIEGHREDDSKYAHFVYAKEQADELEADYTEWVVAQFEGLAFLNAIPELVQLYGENATQRYERFTTKQLEVTDEDDSDNLSTIYKDYEDEES